MMRKRMNLRMRRIASSSLMRRRMPKEGRRAVTKTTTMTTRVFARRRRSARLRNWTRKILSSSRKTLELQSRRHQIPFFFSENFYFFWVMY